MSLPFYTPFSPLTTLETWYQAVHHHRTEPFHHPNATLHFDALGCYTDLGTFLTLADAQRARLCAFNAVMLRFKFTACCKRNKPSVDDFEIRQVQAFPDRWAPFAGCEEGLFAKQNKNENPKTRMPPKPDPRLPLMPLPDRTETDDSENGEERRILDALWPEENEAGFARSRILHWSKRAEGPFRGLEDRPYTEEMGFLRPVTPDQERWKRYLDNMVFEQPDERAEMLPADKIRWHSLHMEKRNTD